MTQDGGTEKDGESKQKIVNLHAVTRGNAPKCSRSDVDGESDNCTCNKNSFGQVHLFTSAVFIMQACNLSPIP